MIEKEYSVFNTIVIDIEYKMLRKEEYCYIKIEPFKRTSAPSGVQIFINGELHKWDIYDKKGKEANKVYFKGFNCEPCFYMKSSNVSYLVKCKSDNIQAVLIKNPQKIKEYIKKNCSCFSPEVLCWAYDLYSTKRPDKHPFNLI